MPKIDNHWDINLRVLQSQHYTLRLRAARRDDPERGEMKVPGGVALLGVLALAFSGCGRHEAINYTGPIAGWPEWGTRRHGRALLSA